MTTLRRGRRALPRASGTFVLAANRPSQRTGRNHPVTDDGSRGRSLPLTVPRVLEDGVLTPLGAPLASAFPVFRPLLGRVVGIGSGNASRIDLAGLGYRAGAPDCPDLRACVMNCTYENRIPYSFTRSAVVPVTPGKLRASVLGELDVDHAKTARYYGRLDRRLVLVGGWLNAEGLL